MKPEIVNPPALGKPVGYANGLRVGSFLFLAGQIGATPMANGRHRVVEGGFVRQFDQALKNVLEVVQAAGGKASNVVEMTVYVKDMDAYRSARKSLGAVWKRTMGTHYPAMTLVEVSDLFEKGALVEIRSVAALG